MPLITIALLLVSTLAGAEHLASGDHTRTLQQDGRTRSYIVHVPPKHDPKQPTPVVLAFHGAWTNAPLMALSTGLSAKADEAGFIVVYPNGSGKDDFFLFWNCGGYRGPVPGKRPDDVAFVKAILDDLATLANVDPKRIYATGMSNGGMMCYRLAAELSERIPSPQDVGRIRMKAMEEFLADFEEGKIEGRYLPHEMPSLPFEDGQFDLALCSHLLFTYSGQMSAEFHCQAMLEMCRVAGEVRVFPLLDHGGQPSPHVQSVCDHLERQGYSVALQSVDYEFQRGGNKMLRAWR
jgi:hypothetical protein